MPSNVSLEFVKAQKKFENATTTQERLLALLEMRSFAPKHKGGENLRRDISKKIAKIKDEIEKQKTSSSKKGSAPSINIKKEGGGQIAIVGLPNSGKSTLLNALTGLNVPVAPYPFTTTKPEVGMMNYKGGLVQLVEVPALMKGSSGGRASGTQMISLIRNADAIVFTVQTEEDRYTLIKELEKSDIIAEKEKLKIEIKPTGFKGITVSGKKFLKMKESELIDFLKRFGYHNATVVLNEQATKEKIVQALNQRVVYKKALFVNPKEFLDIESLKEKIFFLLGKILVFTKKPGQKPDFNEPLVVEKGTTTEQIAKMLHKDFAKNLKFARVWGSTKFEGQRVSKDFKLSHLDIVELS